MEIVQYDEIRAKMDEVKDMCNFIPDVTTDDGYSKSKRVSLDVGKLLTSLEKSRKELKADSLAFGRKVDADAKSLVAELEEFQLPHKEAYKELDNLKKEREKQRKETLDNRVRDMRELPGLMLDADSDGVKMALEQLNNEECLDFYEYTEQALKARNASRECLATMFADKLKQEKEAAELAKLRKEQEAREKKEREDHIAKEAADKATLEAEKAAQAKQERVDRERQEAIEREEAAKRQVEEADRLRFEAEENAKLQIEQTKIQAEKDSKAAVESERKRQKYEKLLEQEEVAKREANKKHVGSVRKAAKESLMKLNGIDEEVAKNIVLAISKGLISNVTINY